MKKLIIAAAIVCAAAMSQAATANWRMGAANVRDGSGDASAMYSGMAYVFDSNTITMSALFAEISKDSSYVAANAIASKAVNNGAIAQTQTADFSYGEGGSSYTLYFVCLDDDKVYFSTSKTATGNASAAGGALAFGNQANSYLKPVTDVTAGQWVTVPEPTSGLLLLLGVAGLALKRRRA